jgi:hypothetical protein
LPTFFLAYGAFTHDNIGLTLANLVFGRELQLQCGVLFGTHHNKEQPTIDHMANLVNHLRNIHNYARQHLKLANDRMKTHYDVLANCVGYKGAMTCGSIGPPTRKESHRSFNLHGRVNTG